MEVYPHPYLTHNSPDYLFLSFDNFNSITKAIINPIPPNNVRKKERLAIIEKIGDKLEPSAFDVKIGLPRLATNFSFSSLKTGCLLAGIGLGLLVGFIISVSLTDFDIDNWGRRELISTADNR